MSSWAQIATEIARDFRGDEYDFDNVDDMLECLDDLAQGTAVGGGSVKSLKKNDRKNQKMTVRNTRVSGNYKLFSNSWLSILPAKNLLATEII